MLYQAELKERLLISLTYKALREIITPFRVLHPL
jgi:hypothetical protein